MLIMDSSINWSLPSKTVRKVRNNSFFEIFLNSYVLLDIEEYVSDNITTYIKEN